ncbi:MAG: peroxiredoxin [Actinobacteria bacterium]|nr:peroxiredoxin [Actinomycetota bacterium]
MKPHDLVPDFDAVDDEGRTVRLSDFLALGPVVLFFYPKAMTPGCTAEACHFRDLVDEFAAFDATPVGISADAVDRQVGFREKYGLNFPILSDLDQRVADAFGVKRWGPLLNRRMTFVIDTDFRLLDVIKSETRFETHADEALSALQAHKG